MSPSPLTAPTGVKLVKYVTELLSSKRVNSFDMIRDEEVNRLLTTVSAQCGSRTDMSKLFFSLANDILCRVAFGKRFMEVSGRSKRVIW
ncbi:hypothetical protein Patl1_16840 [Pistacia atlantica]|uniref:Uncharacterized protein n=1 Tax=Pistacia atlantica TaxID=434234 RepID=A0ACC1B5E5_9ROSI|nr:hypothetical protein Patl1_16840 [Pistacia atlantica]